MIGVGIVGIGFMGVTHYKALQNVEGARVTAIGTRDQAKLNGDWSTIQGNFGDAGGIQDLSGLARYPDWHDMLKDDSVDLVDICLPTHLHRPATIAALEAGKHVLVEKPLALNLEDADAMIAAARAAGKLLMVGQVLRFFPAFAEAVAIVESGKYGKLRAAHFKRIIAIPTWAADNHFQDVSKSGGPALDLHIHDTDYVHYIAGVPNSVHSAGVVAGGAAIHVETQYSYEGKMPCITASSGAIAASSNPFEHGYDIYLERATLQYNSTFTGEEIWLAPEAGEKQKFVPDRPEAFTAELQHAVDCVKAGRESELISGAIARQALQVCLGELESVDSGQTVAIIA